LNLKALLSDSHGKEVAHVYTMAEAPVAPVGRLACMYGIGSAYV
jgi:hypothetical protein